MPAVGFWRRTHSRDARRYSSEADRQKIEQEQDWFPMKLPPLHNPERYTGLYIFDFGDHVSVGYTADEVAALMDSGRFPQGQAYRVYRALPDGTMELELIGRETLRQEDGLLFYRHQVRDARRDFDQLVGLAEHAPPSFRVSVQLAKVQSAGAAYVTAIVFPVEAAPRVSGWLNQIKFDGGDFVRGGSAE